MIYLDSSVALAELFAERTKPPLDFWSQPMVASRLLVYEVWNRVHAHAATFDIGDDARLLLETVSLIELAPAVLLRALDPFPVKVRTLDGLHLATALYAQDRGSDLTFATYDLKLAEAAHALGIPLHDLPR